jgi:hypothetical protein
MVVAFIRKREHGAELRVVRGRGSLDGRFVYFLVKLVWLSPRAFLQGCSCRCISIQSKELRFGRMPRYPPLQQKTDLYLFQGADGRALPRAVKPPGPPIFTRLYINENLPFYMAIPPIHDPWLFHSSNTANMPKSRSGLDTEILQALSELNRSVENGGIYHWSRRNLSVVEGDFISGRGRLDQW